jgi:hypothetical protein
MYRWIKVTTHRPTQVAAGALQTRHAWWGLSRWGFAAL